MRYYKIKISVVPKDVDLYMWYLKRFNKKKWHKVVVERINITGTRLINATQACSKAMQACREALADAFKPPV